MPSSIDNAMRLAMQLHQAGRFAEAAPLYQQVLAQQPNHADASHMLGVLAAQSGRPDIAVNLLRQAIAVRPDFPEAHNNLGNALKATGQRDQAIAAYQQAITLRPNYPEAYNNLGNALKDSGRLDDAIDAYRRAIALRSDFAEAHYNLAAALYDKGQLDETIAAARKATDLKPIFPEAHGTLGNALKDRGQLDEAIDAYRQAIAQRPDDAAAASNLLYAMHFHPAYDAKAIATEARRWNERYAHPLQQIIRPHDNDRTPDRRLRIGYVSPDFREHPVGRFMLPLLAHHDHQKFEIFCYANAMKSDALTNELRQSSDHWHDIAALSDDQAADHIRRHRIDILVDLTMHMDRNRLLLFARKPAPVAVTYLAYVSTTGLSAIDYRLSDPYLDPTQTPTLRYPEESDPAGAINRAFGVPQTGRLIDESIYTERTVRLPRTYWCYQPRATPDVAPTPAIAAGKITFGCLNNFAKASQPALEIWARILQSVPDSRLILHAHEGAHRQRTAKLFRQLGIAPQRIRFVGMTSFNEYLNLYNQIDIALDPFPDGGGTTTCDALWMGVPVITLKGQIAVGRGAVSILSNLDLTDLIADTHEQYIHLAGAFANDLPRLTDLRATLRQRMEQSPLMDAQHFAVDVEAAYRRMWTDYCHNASKS